MNLNGRMIEVVDCVVSLIVVLLFKLRELGEVRVIIALSALLLQSTGLRFGQYMIHLRT